MRSLKKILAVLIALTLMASIMVVPAFAADSFKYEEEAKALNELGLFKGVSETEYTPNLEARLIREEGAALVLRLFNLEAKANEMDEKEAKALLSDKFKDADDISNWAVKIVAYAVQNGIIDGRPDGKFAPQDPLLGKEFAKMILAELKQNYEFQTACADLAAISDLSATEAISFNDKILIRDDVVGISFASLNATYADGKTILSVLSEDPIFKAKAMELGLVTVVKLSVVVEPITIKVGEKVELPAKAEVEYSDGSKAEVALVWDLSAVKTDVAGEYKAVGSVANFDEKVEVAVTVTPDVLAVESVTADNLIEVVVVYNQDVADNAAAADKTNYTLNIGKKVDAVSIDGNTATLKLDGKADNQKKAKLTIDAKVTGTKAEAEFTFFDAKLPEVTGLVVTGPKAIELTFTEPIEKVANFNDVKVTIKSGTSTISVNKGAISGGGTRVLAVPLYSSLVDGKEYEVTVENFVDFAGYKNKIETITFVYEKDVTAPVATVEEATQEYVKVSFNKPVTGLTAGHFSHTFSAWEGIVLTNKNEFKTDGDTVVNAAHTVKTVYVWFYKDGTRTEKDERPIAEGDTSFRIVTKKGTEIKDAWGNKFEEATYTITVAADKTTPEVKEIKVTTEQAFTVEFTKNVKFDSDNIEILDADGKAISGLTYAITANSAKKYTIDLSKNLKGKTIIVNIKNVKDTTLNTNKLDSYSTTLDIADKTAPKIEKVTFETVGTGSDATWNLYIFFDEDVDSDSALNSANYFLKNGAVYTKLTKAAEFYAGNKIVKIALTEAQKKLITVADDGTELFVTSVKDLAGNEISAELTTKNLITAKTADTNAPYMDKAEATAIDKVVVTFSGVLSTYDIDAFRVNDKKAAALEADIKDGKTVITLTLEGDARLSYQYTSGMFVTIVPEEKEAIKDLFEVSPVKLSQEIADKIKPQLVADTDDVKAIRAGDKAGEIIIEFTENLTATDDGYMAFDLVVVSKSDSKTLLPGTGYTTKVDENSLVVTIIGLKKDAIYRISSKDAIQYIKDDSNENLAATFTSVKEVTAKGSDNLAAEAELAAAKADLADKKAEVKDLTEADYTADSWKAVTEALALPEVTTKEVTDKTAAITAAIEALVNAGV